MKFTQSLMIASALVMGALGVCGTFAPDVLLRAIDAPVSPVLQLLVQVMGALLLGLAALNWLGRRNMIGGIYSRPLVIANLMHFVTAGLAMLKFVFTHTVPWPLLGLSAVYAVFAIAFAITLTRHPISTP